MNLPPPFSPGGRQRLRQNDLTSGFPHQFSGFNTLAPWKTNTEETERSSSVREHSSLTYLHSAENQRCTRTWQVNIVTSVRKATSNLHTQQQYVSEKSVLLIIIWRRDAAEEVSHSHTAALRMGERNETFIGVKCIHLVYTLTNETPTTTHNATTNLPAAQPAA